MAVMPDDEFVHANTGEENFNESMYFNFYDRHAGWGGFVRLGNRPNEGYAEMTVAIYRPDGSALFNYMRPPITDNGRFSAGGMRFDVIEPFRRLEVHYDGSAVLLTRPLDLEDPKRAFTSNPHVPVRIELTCTGLSPIYGGVADESAASASGVVFARGHYEQHVAFVGRVTVGGEDVALRALGLRDHSWGPRSWQSPAYYRWLTCEFDEGFGFMGSQIVTRDGTELLSGFVFKDGENHLVHGLEMETRQAGDYHDRIALTLHSDAGDFRVTGKVLNLLPLRNRRDGKITRISEGLTLWRHGKHIGYGLSEYLDQIEG